MKNLIYLLGFIVVVLTSCSKDKKLVEEINQQEILNKKIQEIIPEKYLDSLRKLGMVINTETNPPNIEGAYALSPYVIGATNVPNDSYKPGKRLDDGKVKFSGQNENFDIKLIGYKLLRIRDTSLVTAISGSGNNFTVYGKVRAFVGSHHAIIATIMSGTKDGNNIKDFRVATLNIDDTNAGTGNFIPEGYGRVAYDSDKLSPFITETEFQSAIKEKPMSSQVRSLLGK